MASLANSPMRNARASQPGLANPAEKRVGEADRKASPQGASQTPGASRRSIFALAEEENGNGPPAPSNLRTAEPWLPGYCGERARISAATLAAAQASTGAPA